MASPQAPLAPAATARSSRRRQRSTRLTVAAVLLAVAALLVVGAIVSGSWLLVTTAAVLGVALGAAATRITNAELAEARREAARDRAEQAKEYRRLTEVRTTEHAAFVDTMQERAARQEVAVHQLEDALTAAQSRAAEATRKLNQEARRADAAERDSRDSTERLEGRLAEAEERAAEAVVRVAELEQELDVVRAELDVVTQAWHSAEAGLRKRA
ncbi:hypothetical protein ABLE68_05880 [Nocardioides sp. CN2-186]|uniref:hypothetical protein n=1 Tax=Nocardioides tweenelious TaxID=3156607 RepID=UPI0032B3BB5C